MVQFPASLPTTRPAAPEIRLLRPQDVQLLRLGRHRRMNDAAMHEILGTYPGRSVWAPETLEFALVTPWRHRDEVAVVEELAAVRHAQALLATAVENCRRAGDRMALVLEMDERRRPSFYARAGMSPIEEVITFELPRVRPISIPSALVFHRADPADPATLADLIRIDHRAFPWLWWNSEQEFQVYGRTPGTHLYLGYLDSHPVAYLGISVFPGWGHLDRIAVDPAAQGQGFGHQAVAFAINTIQQRGGRRMALSTQHGNLRSRRIYEEFGFRRSPGFDYRLYGAPMRPPAPGLTTPNGSEETGPANGNVAEDDTRRWAAVSGRSSS